MISPAGTRAIGYVRVNTGEQGESGLGLKAQVAAIRAACALRSWELVEVREEVKSGARADNRARPRRGETCSPGRGGGAAYPRRYDVEERGASVSRSAGGWPVAWQAQGGGPA